MNDDIQPGSDLVPTDDSTIDPPARRRPARKTVTTLHLTSRTCKWPIGDPTHPDFHYCGQLPQTGRPYCDMHDSLSYQATRRR